MPPDLVSQPTAPEADQKPAVNKERAHEEMLARRTSELKDLKNQIASLGYADLSEIKEALEAGQAKLTDQERNTKELKQLRTEKETLVSQLTSLKDRERSRSNKAFAGDLVSRLGVKPEKVDLVKRLITDDVEFDEEGGESKLKAGATLEEYLAKRRADLAEWLAPTGKPGAGGNPGQNRLPQSPQPSVKDWQTTLAEGLRELRS